MANTYFQFKSFTIHQEKTAMKVCTDACLFGAWVAARVVPKLIPGQPFLDIGTGTGLLSLMLAQQSSQQIDAVEIEENAWMQAMANTASSPWPERIKVHRANILYYRPAGNYGLILSNPPFFANDLKAGGSSRNLARHEDSIQLESLFRLTFPWLSNEGYWAILVPAHRAAIAIESACREGLFLLQETRVRQTSEHDAFRSMLLFGRNKAALENDEIIIRPEGKYSQEFIELLQPYYLHL